MKRKYGGIYYSKHFYITQIEWKSLESIVIYALCINGLQ